MNRIALYSTAILIACCATVCYAGFPWLTPQYKESGKTVEQWLADYQSFKKSFNGSQNALAAGEITLTTACDQVIAAAGRYHPEYLTELPRFEIGYTDRERVARNLVGHLQDRAEDSPALAPRLRELEVELEDLVSNLN
jgi:hypothetical protein